MAKSTDPQANDTVRQEKAKAAVEQMRAAEKESRTATTGRERVAAAIKNIRAFHELGRNLAPKPSHKDAYGRGIIKQEKERLQLGNEDTLRKARMFADPVTGYTKSELHELCSILRKKQPVIREVRPGEEQELPIFQRTHVIRLLSIARKKQRLALQKKCIAEGWSTAELEAEIARRFGTRRAGGRKRMVPKDEAALLTQLERMCEEWRRWRKQLGEKITVLRELATFVENLCTEILSLQDAVLDALEQLQSGRERRDISERDADENGGKKPSGSQRGKP